MVGALAPNSPITALLHAAAWLAALRLAGSGRPARSERWRPAWRPGLQPTRLTSSAVDRLSNIIRSGGAMPSAITPMGPRVASPLAALLTGSGVSAFRPAQPYPPGLGAVFAQ
jgi:hypothetical protein